MKILLILICLTSLTFSQVDSIVTYYDNGNIQSIIHYKNGVRDGDAIFYRENGKLKQELSYFNGKVNGLVTNFDENGVLREMFSIENGKREGPTSYFDSTGEYLKDVFYTEGKIDVEEEPLTYSKYDDLLKENEKSNNKNSNMNKKKINKTVDPNQPLPPSIDDERNLEEDPAFYMSVEIMPEPIGGLDAIYRKITYPKEAKENNIEGTVIIRVFIDRDGEVLDAQVVKGIGYGCDEAARLAIFYHRFKPGLLRGKRVKVQMDIPIEFKMKNYED